MLPIDAPAAATLTAWAARFVPLSPRRAFLSRSWFSMSVALAGKMAGNARNSPPISGPNFFAMLHYPTDDGSVDEECYRTDHHGTCLRRHVAGTFQAEGQSEGG